MDNVKVVMARLLFSLARKRKWGESHTAYENLFKSFKSESLGKDGMNLATNLAEELVRSGLILKKPTHYGLQVSLNPRMAHEIKRIIRESLGFDI
jgi:hypothetical protein